MLLNGTAKCMWSMIAGGSLVDIPCPSPTLLQSATAAGQARSVKVLIAVGLLIVVVLALGLIILHMRRTLLKAEGGDGGSGLLLDDLRAMKRRGEISEQEFERMKQKLAAQLSAALVKTDTGRSDKPSANRHASKSVPNPPLGNSRQGSAQSGLSDGAGPEKRARPGYDLTGEKLPEPGDGG